MVVNGYESVEMMRFAKTALLLFLSAFLSLSVFAEAEDAFAIPRAEFAKYYTAVTGKPVPESMVRFVLDPKVSKTGKDAYSIMSERRVKDNAPYQGGDGREYPPSEASAENDSMRCACPQAVVTITGSNIRSVMYGVYDLLERRAGCRWFWDGDIVPKKGAIDLSGLDVHEESRFEYRGLRYFAHRGLTRFQAEHWGFDDWKKEIDWCIKSRLNLFMLRVGQDDLFQKAFPDVCPYPDPSRPIPEAMSGYDNRSLFWSLQFRGELRKKVMDYAFARGMMAPEDFGTMSHWYSRTPKSFLEKMNPPFLPQQGGCYGDPTDRVWDIRDRKWLDAYWHLTETSIANYGKPDLLHTIGIAERHCFTNRVDNLTMKCDMLDLLVQNAASHYPKSKVLFAGWDFYLTWQPDEVKQLVKTLDPNRILLWDYEADAIGKRNFTEWDVIGKFPYTFGIFLCYEAGIDIRANYSLIHERQKLVENDPMCKGYILWPESSHTDSLCLNYFTANAWRANHNDTDALLSEFCRDRYGDQANDFESLWRAVLPVSTNNVGWGGNYGKFIFGALADPKVAFAPKTCEGEFSGYECIALVFRSLAKLDLSDECANRDAFDLARTAGDRLTLAFAKQLLREAHAITNGTGSAALVRKDANLFVRLVAGMSDILELHTDYSLWESLERLNAVRPVENPDFGRVLFDNAVNHYCASHQYEAARYVYLPMARRFAEWISAVAERGGREHCPFDITRPELAAALARPLESMKPTAARTPENIRATFNAFAALAEVATVTVQE